MYKEAAKVKLSPFWVTPEMKANVAVITGELEKNYTNTMIHLIELGIDAHLKNKAAERGAVVEFPEGTGPSTINMAAVPYSAKEALGIMPDRTVGCADDFEIFWTAGMVKNNKKKALSLFKSLSGKNGGSLIFARKLADDVRYRIDAGQMGFDSLHPTTYLNNERWNDALPIPKQCVNSGVDQSSKYDGMAAPLATRGRIL